jgi:hypothetical protein
MSICLLGADGECISRAGVMESAGRPLKVGVVGVELASNQPVAPSGAQIVVAAQASALWAGMLIPPWVHGWPQPGSRYREPLKRSSSTVTKIISSSTHATEDHHQHVQMSWAHEQDSVYVHTQCSRTLAMLNFWSYFEAYGLTRNDRPSLDLRIVFVQIHRTIASCWPIPEFYNPNAFACSSGYPSTTKK